MITDTHGITTIDIALAAEHCPVAGGASAKNELDQDCSECMATCPERAALCDTLQRGKGYDLSPLLDVVFPVKDGFGARIRRRVGL